MSDGRNDGNPTFSATAHQSGQPPKLLWQQGQRFDMAGTDHGEMPPVEGSYLFDIEALGQCDDCCVAGTETEIGIALNQLGHSPIVGAGQLDRREVAIG
jgi:hypothetical protein